MLANCNSESHSRAEASRIDTIRDRAYSEAVDVVIGYAKAAVHSLKVEPGIGNLFGEVRAVRLYQMDTGFPVAEKHQFPDAIHSGKLDLLGVESARWLLCWYVKDHLGLYLGLRFSSCAREWSRSAPM